MTTFTSGDRVPYSWPTRWTVPQPTFHAVDEDNHLWTGCEQVISGPRWVTLTELPPDFIACPCLDRVLEASWERATLNHDIDPDRYVE